MDVREYVEGRAAGLPAALREWLAVPSVLAGPARHDGVAVGLDAGRIDAPNGYVDLSRLLRGAETAAYLREDLSGLAQADLR
jgi:hypothetical protein